MTPQFQRMTPCFVASLQCTLCIMLNLPWACCDTFKLGMMSPFRHPRLGWENNAAAATIAVEKAQQEGILAGHTISVLWRDDKCNAPGGTAATLLHKEEDIDVLIGPPCSGATTPSGLLASYWNLPMFSQASSDPKLADKSTYTTLVRLGPPFNKMGKAFVELFRHYNWTRVVIISKRKNDNRNVFCDYSARSIEESFNTNGIEIADFIHIDAGITDNTINTYLDRAKQRGRIILFCTEIMSDRRRTLIRAYEKGMTTGDYVFIMPDHLPPSNIETPWIQDDEYDAITRLAYTSAFQVSVAEMAGPDVEAFRDLVSEKMADPPWNYNYTLNSGIRGSVYSAFLHDVVYLYLLTLDETLANNEDHRNGSLMFNRAQGKTFRGMTGNVKVDNNGDREPDYWVWDLVPDGNQFHVAMEISLTSSTEQKVKMLKEVVWETADGLPPPSTPPCGFSNELCPPHIEDKTFVTVVLPVFLIAIFLVVGITGFVYHRRAKFEKEVQMQLWRINVVDIKRSKGLLQGSISQLSLASVSAKRSCDVSTVSDNQLFSSIGSYRGNVCAIKNIDPKCIQLTRKELLELKIMKEMHHENVNMFIGMCVDETAPCILTAYCNKGSLEDIIENDDIKLDWMFKVSLLTDLYNGLHYIHSTAIRYHGNIKSSNCLVDSRWVLKITDYGLSKLRNQNRTIISTQYRFYTAMLCTSPELLDVDTQHREGNSKADVYAFGIVMFEILYRRVAYESVTLQPDDIVKRVHARETPALRPTTYLENLTSLQTDWSVDVNSRGNIQKLMESCWEDVPDNRPTMGAVKQAIIALVHTGRKRVNIVDNMVKMLEKYSANLESIVEQRTSQLIDEKKKTDLLLYRMLPLSVAEELKAGKTVVPEVYEAVTIYFSDIVGFTSLSSQSTPIQIIDLLNDLYTAFDSTIYQHDVYKVETIGDAYMAVSGLPVRNGNRHCKEIANMSLDLLCCAKMFKIAHTPETPLKLRIGFHTGPCAAGVVGRTMPRYCLFGDTVNMASRMESTGEAMKIHISESSKLVLEDTGGFLIEMRGYTEVKGKGSLPTFWLLGRNEQ